MRPLETWAMLLNRQSPVVSGVTADGGAALAPPIRSSALETILADAGGCFSLQPYSLHFAQFLEHGGRVRILRIKREGLFVVLDGLGLLSRSQVRLAEAIVCVS